MTTISCTSCGLDRPIIECYANSGECRSCASRFGRSSIGRIGLVKLRGNAIRCATKWVEKLVLEGECLVCKGVHFHSDGCEADALLKKLREIQ